MLSTALRAQKLTSQHALLAQRVIRLSQHLHLLIPQIRSSAIRPEEETMQAVLEEMEDELRRGGIGKGRMNELWGVIGQLHSVKKRESFQGENVEWGIVDGEGLARLARVRIYFPCDSPFSDPCDYLTGFIGTTAWISAFDKNSAG